MGRHLSSWHRNQLFEGGPSKVQLFAIVAQLDTICLESELRQKVPTMCDPPKWMRGLLRQCYMVSLHGWRKSKSEQSWELLISTPRMLLRPTHEKEVIGKQEIEGRARMFSSGEWVAVLADCHK